MSEDKYRSYNSGNYDGKFDDNYDDFDDRNFDSFDNSNFDNRNVDNSNVDNRNISNRKGSDSDGRVSSYKSSDQPAHFRVADEIGFEDENKSFDNSAQSLEMPPRNILETDSAKYTAAYIKEVVKDLYSTDTKAYIDSNGETVYRPVKDQVEEQSIDLAAERSKARAEHERKAAYKLQEQSEEARRGRQFQKQEPTFKQQKLDDDVFDKESFLKSFEDRVSKEMDDSDRTSRDRRLNFSSYKSSDDTARIESILNGKNNYGEHVQNSYDMDGDNEYEYDEKPAKYDERNYSEPKFIEPKPDEQKYVKYRDINKPDPRNKSNENLDDEKIPIIINKSIEGRPKKTSSDYRNITSQREPQNSRVSKSDGLNDSYAGTYKSGVQDDKGRGVNIFAVIFMAACVVVIGLLVYRISVLSKSADDRMSNAEGVTQLEAAVMQLTTQNNDLKGQVEELNTEVERLSRENEELSTGGSPQVADGASEAEAEQPQQGGSADVTYTIKSGDSLYKIAQEQLGNGNLYPKIAEANNMDPSKPLIAGQKLKIPR